MEPQLSFDFGLFAPTRSTFDATLDATPGQQQEATDDFRDEPETNSRHENNNTTTTNGGGGEEGFTNLEDLIRKVLREELSTVYSDAASNSATQSLLSLIGSSLAAEVSQNVKQKQEVGTSAEERRHYRVSELEPYVEEGGQKSLFAYLNRFEEEWNRESVCCSQSSDRSKYGHAETNQLVHILRTKIPTRFHIALQIDVSTYREISTYEEAIGSLRKLWQLRNLETSDEHIEQTVQDFEEGDVNWEAVKLYRALMSQKFRPKDESMDVFLLRIYSFADQYCKQINMKPTDRDMFAATTLYESFRLGLPSKMRTILAQVPELISFSQLREAAAQSYAKLVREGIYPSHIPKDITDSSSPESSDDEETDIVPQRTREPLPRQVTVPPSSENGSNHSATTTLVDKTPLVQNLPTQTLERSAPVAAIPTFDITLDTLTMPPYAHETRRNSSGQQDNIAAVTTNGHKQKAPEPFYNRDEEYFAREDTTITTTRNLSTIRKPCRYGTHCHNPLCRFEHPEGHTRKKPQEEERHTELTSHTFRMTSEERDAPCRYTGHRGHTNGDCKKQQRERINAITQQTSHLQDAIGEVYAQMKRSGTFPSYFEGDEENGSLGATTNDYNSTYQRTLNNGETRELSASAFDLPIDFRNTDAPRDGNARRHTASTTTNIEKSNNNNKRKAQESIDDQDDSANSYAQNVPTKDKTLSKTLKQPGKNGPKAKKQVQQQNEPIEIPATRRKRQKTDQSDWTPEDPGAPCKYKNHMGHTNANCQKQMWESGRPQRLPGPNPQDLCQMHPDADHTNAQCRKGARLPKRL